MSYVMEIRGLEKHYTDFSLCNVDLSLAEGMVTGFIGVNGAGKTTTIKSALGLIIPDAGEIRFFGNSCSDHNVKNRIGVILDIQNFYEMLTLKEMKNIVAKSFKKWDERAYQGFISRFELPERKKIKELSKGMRMKFAIALALSHNADLLIMDEPTSGLDPLVRAELLDILREYMRTEGRTVFFSTHITSDLDKIADYLILIDNGRIIMQGEKDALIDSHGVVKGHAGSLNDEIKKLLVGFRVNAFGFSGLTHNKAKIHALLPDALIEKPSIEDLMLYYVRRDHDAAQSY
ncbi:MAG: Daunorubicin/doxorubicin resistance ATP-binding protein DrrA [Firmicutes bacterium ADurb.Bin182]|nr:MAG: Daunorubicin/doxorubicin resistance ATP-binding protein DrrA [Firmicutes bacterium ADurb.Bin182]